MEMGYGIDYWSKGIEKSMLYRVRKEVEDARRLWDRID